jgi:DNA-binding MarR family transcriptional regulator
MGRDKLKGFFLNEKPVMALVTIRRQREEVYGSIISKKIDTTYAHTVKILSRLEENGLIETEKKGRKKILTLTDKGETYADNFIDLLTCFEEEGINEKNALRSNSTV